MATSTLTQLLNYELLIIYIVPWEEQIYTPLPRPPYLGAHFYIFVILAEVAINFLWTHYEFFSRFSRSKHNEFWSRHHCINSVTVQLLWPVISLVYNLQGGKLSTAKKIQLLQAPVASFVCAELF